ncbi:MAG: membrane dipeptidase [Hyphomicrobiales bacterium]|nr:membrane dipeptidase [Hyphomicrobiales bacterium]
MTDTTAPATGTREDVKRVLSEATICDHTLPYAGPPEEEIAHHKAAGFTYASITIASDMNPSFSAAMERLAREHRYYAANDDFILVRGVADIRRAKAEGKVAIGFHFQGTEPVARDLDNVWGFRAMGIRWMLLAYNWQNNTAVGCIEAQERDVGLSVFGRQLVREMSAAGMIVDLSHTGRRCTFEAMELSEKPCMFSHSNVLARFAHPRNIDDEQIRKVAEGGGVIGVTGVGEFTGERGTVRTRVVFEHIDHIVQLTGSKHVGLGLDYMSGLTCDAVIKKLKGDLTKVGMSPLPWAFMHPGQLGELIAIMIDAGYGTAAIHDILGNNFLRVAEACWTA